MNVFKAGVFSKKTFRKRLDFWHRGMISWFRIYFFILWVENRRQFPIRKVFQKVLAKTLMTYGCHWLVYSPEDDHLVLESRFRWKSWQSRLFAYILLPFPFRELSGVENFFAKPLRTHFIRLRSFLTHQYDSLEELSRSNPLIGKHYRDTRRHFAPYYDRKCLWQVYSVFFGNLYIRTMQCNKY